jgi:hypothetical protein
MQYSVPSSEKTKAVKYLIDHIPDETLRDVKNAMDQNPKEWWIGHHHGFGTGVRNLLREGGFEGVPSNWMICGLDSLKEPSGKNFNKSSHLISLQLFADV